MNNAFLFDLNGTIIDDMDFHATAWYDILNNDLGANLSREEVKSQMYGKNDELLIRIFGENHFSRETMDALSFEKERRYQQAFTPHLKLINGLDLFLEKSLQLNIPMAIGSAAILFNIDYILDGLQLRHYFKSIVSAGDVQTSKPDPETFIKCAEELGFDRNQCIVFEDAPKGVEAALNAGMQAVVIKTYHEESDFAHLPNVLFFIEDYRDPRLEKLLL